MSQPGDFDGQPMIIWRNIERYKLYVKINRHLFFQDDMTVFNIKLRDNFFTEFHPLCVPIMLPVGAMYFLIYIRGGIKKFVHQCYNFLMA